MKRIDIVNLLLKEGFSEKTLLGFSDKQLLSLKERLFNEAEQKVVNQTKYTNAEIAAMKSSGKGFSVDGGSINFGDDGSVTVTHGQTEEGEMSETLKGGQKKLDKNKNGKLDKFDFKLLRKEKQDMKEGQKMCSECGMPMMECKCDDKSEMNEGDKKWIQKAMDPKKKGQLHKDLGVSQDKKIPLSKLKSAAKKSGKVGQRARMAMNLRKLDETNTVKNWVSDVVDSNYHSFTSKGEIMELIKSKINENDMSTQHGPSVQKGHNGIPEFMTYSSIKNSELSKNETMESSPSTKPVTKPPKTTPGTKPKPKDPLKPGKKGNPKPMAENSPSTKPVTKPPKTTPGTKPKPKDPLKPGKKGNPKPMAESKYKK